MLTDDSDDDDLAEVADAAAEEVAGAADVLAEIADAADEDAAEIDLPIAPAGEEILNGVFGLTFYNSKLSIPVEPIAVAEKPPNASSFWNKPGFSPAMLSWDKSSLNNLRVIKNGAVVGEPVRSWLEQAVVPDLCGSWTPMPSVVIALESPESRSTESTELQLSPITHCAGIDHIVVEGSSTGEAIQGSENRETGDSKSTCVKAIDFAEVEESGCHKLAVENDDVTSKVLYDWSEILESLDPETYFNYEQEFGAGFFDFDRLEKFCPTGGAEEDHWSQPIQKTPSAGHPCRTLETTKQKEHSQTSLPKRLRKHRKFGRRLNFSSGKFEPLSKQKSKVPDFPPGLEVDPTKEFENMRVHELRSAVGCLRSMHTSTWEPIDGQETSSSSIDGSGNAECGAGRNCLDLLGGGGMDWIDADPELHIFENEEEERDLMNINWRSEADTWQGKRWIKVESVVDSGAAAPVAPPTMAPHVQIEESEGSKRGQKWTSASKHKLKNLGQQRIHAATESGNPTDVLFQIAEVGKPLVSVSAICERGNRVIFGKGGGVVKNVRTGAETPFYRKNGVYIMSLWLMDEPHSQESPFTRP